MQQPELFDLWDVLVLPMEQEIYACNCLFFHSVEEGIQAGLSFEESYERGLTIYNCRPMNPPECQLSTESSILVSWEWYTGCRGKPEDCCYPTELPCDQLVSQEVLDIKKKDQQTLCILSQCYTKDVCMSDKDCEKLINCRAETGKPTIAKCDTDAHSCYCASTCPDGYCDYYEASDSSCPQDCPEKQGDNDTDGVDDWQELNFYGTNTSSRDSDNDGYDDWQEIERGSDPTRPDTDMGGQCDGPNQVPGVCRAGPDPCPLDSQNLCFSGVPNGESPRDFDRDQDGINNYIDSCPIDPTDNCQLGNDPDIDTDGDGIPEAWARQYFIDSPWDDPDLDELSNYEEYESGTNPLKPDSNDNGLPDVWEVDYNLSNATDDEDSDGLSNIEEYFAGTDPTNPDTDADGIMDGDEGLIPDNDTIIKISVLDIFPKDEYPQDGIYSFRYGDTIEQIILEAKYSNGVALLDPVIFAELVVQGGNEKIYIPFEKTISTNFVSNLEYDLLQKNNEAPFMTLNVIITDALGNVGKYSTRLFILHVDEDKFRILVSKPHGTYAYGQKAIFEVLTEGLSMDTVDMEVFVEGTGQQFSLYRQGDTFVGEYPIETDAPDPLFFYFLVFATGNLQDEYYDSVRRIEINVKPVLDVEYLENESSSELYVFDVKYPNGDSVPDNALRCKLNEYDTILNKDKLGHYYAKFPLEMEEDIVVEIRDSYDNIGKTKIEYDTVNVVFDFGAVFSAVFSVAIILVVLFLLYNWFMSKRTEIKTHLADKKRLIKRKKQLTSMIKDVKKRYYKKKVSGEYASRKVADYEGEIKLIDEELEEMGEKKFRLWKF
jgi:hypothetical protein